MILKNGPIREIALSVQTCRNPAHAGNSHPPTGGTFSNVELDELAPNRNDAGCFMTVEVGALDKGNG